MSIVAIFCLTNILVPADDPKVADAAIRLAITRGLQRLEAGSTNYLKNRQCFSCHHQALTIAAFRSAQQRGFAVNADRIKEQVDFTRKSFSTKLDKVAKGQAIPGASTMAAYALFALESGGQGPDEVSEALVEYLLVRQKEDGSWPALMSRPPSEGSVFTNNALALRGLKRFGTAKQKDRADPAWKKGLNWLRNNKPRDTEEKVFQLHGLVAGQLDKKEVEVAREALAKEQKPDGSWAQIADMPGDAYATATVLFALRAAGTLPDDRRYRKGVEFLVKNQKQDGSWLVATRSRPVQIFFDNGDPGGKSQFISFAATGWATLALLETCGKD